jgi:hypothetical protein
VPERLGNRVKHRFTSNEFAAFVEPGYQGTDVQVGDGKTVHLGAAPGLRLSDSELKQVSIMPCSAMASPCKQSAPAAQRARR